MSPNPRIRRAFPTALLLLLPPLLWGCQEVELAVPTAEEVRAFYEVRGELEVQMNGNVAELSFIQSQDQLRRGGALWARSGPYIFLFSQGTRDVLSAYPGLAGVRVTSRPPSGEGMVATAFLHRSTLNAITWRRALSMAGVARRDASTDPGQMGALVRYGEQTVDSYEYNPRYVPPR